MVAGEVVLGCDVEGSASEVYRSGSGSSSSSSDPGSGNPGSNSDSMRVQAMKPYLTSSREVVRPTSS